jgi:hypothetical protein
MVTPPGTPRQILGARGCGMFLGRIYPIHTSGPPYTVPQIPGSTSGLGPKSISQAARGGARGSLG